MSRSSLNVHTQRFQLGTTTLVLATGTPEQVIDYVKQKVDNAMNLIAAGSHAGGHKAMALVIDGQGFDQRDRELAISSDLVKAILGGYDTSKWNFLSMVSASQDNAIDVAIGSPFFKDNADSRTFVKGFACAIYDKGGNVKGTDTRTLLLFATDTERFLLAWERDSNKDTIIAQPWGAKLTRYAVAGNTLVAARAGSGQVKAMSFAEIKAQINDVELGDKLNWQVQTTINDAQIEDLTLGNQGIRGNYAVVMSGTFQGKYGLKVLNITTDDTVSIRIFVTSQPVIRVGQSVATYGAPVRYDGEGVTFINRNGGSAAVTSVPLSALPTAVRRVFQPGAQEASAY